MESERFTLIFSIGNPGPSTRHSLGHHLLGFILKEFGMNELVKATKYKYSISKAANLILVKSDEYMNNSGKSFKDLIINEKIKWQLTNIYILYDEFDLNLGECKLYDMKKGCSHNGIRSLKSTIASINRDLNIYRIGIGIGPKPSQSKEMVISWALSNFKLEEKEIIKNSVLPKLFYCIHLLLDDTEAKIDLKLINLAIKSSFG